MSERNEVEKIVNGTMRTMACVLIGSLIGRGLRGCADQKRFYENNDTVSIVAEETTVYPGIKEFNPGEHSISVPFKIDKETGYELTSYPGYKIAGVSIEKNKGCVMYVNDEKVTCTTVNVNKDGDYVYNCFGCPENYVTIEDNNDTNKVFEKGDHVIMRPIDNPIENVQQYPYVEGYEIISICYDINDEWDTYRKGYIVYQNIEKVECTKTSSGYTEFGTVVKTLTYKNN